MSQQALDEFRKRHPQYSKDKVSDEELAQLLIKKYPMFDKSLGDIAIREPSRPARDLLAPEADETKVHEAPGASPSGPTAPLTPGAASPAPGVPGEPPPPAPEAERRPPTDTPLTPTAAPGGGPSGAPPPLPLPAAGVAPAPGVLDAPRDVATDEQGRVLTDPFTKNATTTAALKTAAGIALPMAGQAVGGIVGGGIGTAVAGPGPGTYGGVLAGESAGGMAGEAAAQYLGLNPESRPQIVLAGAVPLVGPAVQAIRHPKEVLEGVANVGRNVAGRIGAGYNRAQEKAASALRELPDTLKTGGDYKALYKEADRRIAMNPARITTANTQQMIKNLRNQISPNSTDPKLGRLLTVMDTLDNAVMHKTPQGTVASIKQLRMQLRDLKSLLKEPEANALWGAIIQDLEAAAATSPTAAALRAAANSFKGDMAARRFTAIVNGAITEKEGLTAVNGSKILRALDNDPEITRFLSQAEINRLKGEVARRAKIPGPKIKFTTPAGIGGIVAGIPGLAAGALPVLGAIGKHTLDEVADVAINPMATRVASLVLQGARSGWAEEDE